MDGVNRKAECFAGETAVINSVVPLQKFVLASGALLLVQETYSAMFILIYLVLLSCSTAKSSIFLGTLPPNVWRRLLIFTPYCLLV